MAFFISVSVWFQFDLECGTEQSQGGMANKKKTKKDKKSLALCEHCGRGFSKTANLNAHVEKVHRGLRWRCPICHEDQVSKFSHERHYKISHPDETLSNPDENMRYSGVYDYLPQKAKDSVIKKLKTRNSILEGMLQTTRKKLLDKMKENMDLKARLGLDIEAEKIEYNAMIEPNDIESSDNKSESENNRNEENEDVDEETFECSTIRPNQNSDDDPLKHITESDPGAGPSKQ